MVKYLPVLCILLAGCPLPSAPLDYRPVMSGAVGAITLADKLPDATPDAKPGDPCPECNGTGRTGDGLSICNPCKGTGKVPLPALVPEPDCKPNGDMVYWTLPDGAELEGPKNAASVGKEAYKSWYNEVYLPAKAKAEARVKLNAKGFDIECDENGCRIVTMGDGQMVSSCAGADARAVWESAMSELAIGDPVEVLDEGLAMLRRVCPDMPPNHHGRVSDISGDTVLVEFPIDGSYEGHSQVSPYPAQLVRRR